MVGKVLCGCGIAASLLGVANLARPGGPDSALAAPPTDQPANAASYDVIDRYLERQLSSLKVPGAALAIVEGDQMVHARGFGQAQPGGEAPTPRTPFAIGSVTKSFTALAVMQLVEAGKLDLDAPVVRYLPWFRVGDPRVSSQMTVRQLLIQTSGLSTASGWAPDADFDNNPGAGERQARALATDRLRHPPGWEFEYSNTNYNLLGLIIEATSGESYEAYIQNHIFGPLDMRHSYASRTEAQQNGLAMGYRFWFGQPIADPNGQFPRGSLPSGFLFSTTEDMTHWLIAQLNDGRYGTTQILSPAGIAEMHRPGAEFKAMGMSFGWYGMGWIVERQGQTTLLSHSGIVPDFFAYAAFLPGQKKGMVLLLNADHFMYSNLALEELGRNAAALLAGDRPSPVRWGFISPWLMRGLLLVPVLQALGVALTLRRIRRWQRHPDSRPSPGRKWVLHVMLPSVPNALLGTTPILLLTSSLRGFLFLYGPDFSWIAIVCGGFAALWTFVRTGLVLRTLRKGGPRKSVPHTFLAVA